MATQVKTNKHFYNVLLLFHSTLVNTEIPDWVFLLLDQHKLMLFDDDDNDNDVDDDDDDC